jgi:tetratricopeptide (TPR) repeat protein
MFPHLKLDWHAKRLEGAIEARPDDAAARAELARVAVSQALFHDGGEAAANRALTHARRALQADPDAPDALVSAAVALVLLDRLDMAQRHVDRVLGVAHERADAHLAAGLLARAQRDLPRAVRSYELACRLSPEAWEPHVLLGRLLWRLAESSGFPSRLVERAAFHLVRALGMGVATAMEPGLRLDLATAIVQGGRLAEAHKLLARLADHDRVGPKALALLGTVDQRLGKHKNAVLNLRRHIETVGDSAPAWARMAEAYLSLGESGKARDAAQKALSLDPGQVDARYLLALAFLAEGREDDGVRELKSLLVDVPDHADAFHALVRIRTKARDVRWLRGALRSEVGVHDRLPAEAIHDGRPSRPRRSTRDRVGVLLAAVREVDPEAVTTVAGALDLSTDEGLRMMIWEAALEAECEARASVARSVLGAPSGGYSAGMGREIVAVAQQLDDDILQKGLHLEDADLGKAAVERHGPARDVRAHRAALDRERREARAWQALLLLALGARCNPSTRPLLQRWTTEADPDLADAARVALVLQGDAEAEAVIRRKARARGIEPLVGLVAAGASPMGERGQPGVLTDAPERACAVCGRRTPEVGHIVAGPDAAMCDRCMAALAQERRDLPEPPDAPCRLCGALAIDGRSVWTWRGTEVCQECLDLSLGRGEREEIANFLALAF